MSKTASTTPDALERAARAYVHGPARTYWAAVEVIREMKNRRLAKELQEELANNAQAEAQLAFMREVAPLIEGNERLTWLYRIAADSLADGWKMKASKIPERARNRRNAERRFTKKIARRELEAALPRHETITSLARHFSVDVKTLKNYATKWEIELPSRRKRANRSA